MASKKKKGGSRAKTFSLLSWAVPITIGMRVLFAPTGGRTNAIQIAQGSGNAGQKAAGIMNEILFETVGFDPNLANQSGRSQFSASPIVKNVAVGIGAKVVRRGITAFGVNRPLRAIHSPVVL